MSPLHRYRFCPDGAAGSSDDSVHGGRRGPDHVELTNLLQPLKKSADGNEADQAKIRRVTLPRSKEAGRQAGKRDPLESFEDDFPQPGRNA